MSDELETIKTAVYHQKMCDVLYSEKTEELSENVKVDWESYNSCGNCTYFRDLTVSESEKEDFENYKTQNFPIPKVCGANPPQIVLVIVPLGGLSSNAGNMVQKLQNVWPSPSADTPACHLFSPTYPPENFRKKRQ